MNTKKKVNYYYYAEKGKAEGWDSRSRWLESMNKVGGGASVD